MMLLAAAPMEELFPPLAEVEALQSWWQEALADQLKEVKTGKRLVGSPVVALVPEDAPNPQMRAMMKAMGQEVPAVKPVLEINPRHNLVKKLAALRTDEILEKIL